MWSSRKLLPPVLPITQTLTRQLRASSRPSSIIYVFLYYIFPIFGSWCHWWIHTLPRLAGCTLREGANCWTLTLVFSPNSLPSAPLHRTLNPPLILTLHVVDMTISKKVRDAGAKHIYFLFTKRFAHPTAYPATRVLSHWLWPYIALWMMGRKAMACLVRRKIATVLFIFLSTWLPSRGLWV